MRKDYGLLERREEAVTPYEKHEAYRRILAARIERLRRYAYYQQDGRGRVLEPQELRLVQHAIKATDDAWWQSWCETEGIAHG